MSELPRKRLVGYADRMSACPGDTIAFMVSAEGTPRYEARLVRLISGDHHPDGCGFIERPVASAIDGSYAGRPQALHAGSCAVIDPPGPLGVLSAFTLQAMVWPTTPDRPRQVILGMLDPDAARGFALVLERGAAALAVGDGRHVTAVGTGLTLPERRWVLVAASYDPATGTARMIQAVEANHADAPPPVVAEHRIADAPTPSGVPFTIAATMVAAGARSRPCHVFNGKIDAARVADRVWSHADMVAARGRDTCLPGTVAAWDFSQGIATDRVHDRGPNRLDGRLVNMPTRAMKGWTWTGDELNWKHAPDQYGAIHFHDDDLHDAGWDADFRLTLPDDLPSGVYAARLEAAGEVEHIPFVVRPPRGRASADAVFLVPTASYLAYANERGGLEGGGYLHAFANHVVAFSANDLWLNDHPEVGGSLYDRHADGSGVAYTSRLRPIVNFRPGVTDAWIGAAGTAPWQFNADLPLISWLDAKGIACDTVTDEDLDAEGLALVAPYKVILTGSHPEYWSKPMYDALHGFLARGGRLMYLGGNGFYWRVAFHPTVPGIMELRRAEDGIRDWVAEGGEYYHAFTGEYGGMWCRMGRSIHALAGVGMAGQGFDVSTYYRRAEASRDPRYAWVFAGVDGDVIGDFGTVGGGAAGLEVDRCDFGLGSPRHTVVLASSENLSDTYFPPPEEINNASSMMDARQNPNVRANMTLYATPSGGAVFSVGSITWIGSLSHKGFDNSVSRVTENVLRRFLDPTLLD
jgi:N,N-dimethylformamidase